MEDGLRVGQNGLFYDHFIVLILVVMEDGLREENVTGQITGIVS